MAYRQAILRCGAAWLALGAAMAPAAAQERPYRPVTQERLASPAPANWLMYRRTYDGWGYSPLDRIDTSNVASLAPAWTFSTSINEGHQSPPIVNEGTLFITTPGSRVLALDARTGELLWRFVPELPEDLQQMHPTNRGVALWGDKVFVATVDARLIALDARTGNVAWETAVEDYSAGYYMTLAPLAVEGKVMVGVSGGEWGIRGFVAAYGADTGDELWKTYTIPGPGEPGHDSWPGDTWRTGGVPVWVTGTYDPELRLTYWGTGNGGPWMGDARPGDNLYATSVLALDVDTGELKAHHQYHWNDSWDWDEVDSPLLIDVERDGRTRKALVHPGRNAYLWVLERSADSIDFLDATRFVYQDVFTSIDPETGRPEYDPAKTPATGAGAVFCPSWSGGKNWPPAAYNPNTKLLYIPANEYTCSYLEGVEDEYRPGRTFMGMEGRFRVARGRRSLRRTAGVEPGHPGEGVDGRVRATALGPGADHRRGPGVHGRHQRPLLPRLQRRDRRTPVAPAHELRDHRRAHVLRGRRRPVHRRAVRLGGRRPARHQPPGRRHRYQDLRPPGRRALGLRAA